MSTEREPWLKVAGAMVGVGSGVEGEATDSADGHVT